MSTLAISAADLRERLSGARPPLVIDVRKQPAFIASREMIAGAVRRDPEQIPHWARSLPAPTDVVVYCVHGHEVSQSAASELSRAGVEEGWKAAAGALDHKPAGAATRWVTRERPKIDRIACPWLVSRFVDAGAEFVYVPAKEVQDVARACDAVPYDIADVHFGHRGDRCSFDAFIAHYRLSDPALGRLAAIVRAADTSRLDLAPQASGLAAISQGLSRNFADDHEMLRHGMVMYDALYTWCREQARAA